MGAFLTKEEREETFFLKGEEHYVWPKKDMNGFFTRCGECAYFLPHGKESRYWNGECTSVCCNTEKGYVHRANGNDYVHDKQMACKWFWPVEKGKSGEQQKIKGF